MARAPYMNQHWPNLVLRVVWSPPRWPRTYAGSGNEIVGARARAKNERNYAQCNTKESITKLQNPRKKLVLPSH